MKLEGTDWIGRIIAGGYSPIWTPVFDGDDDGGGGGGGDDDAAAAAAAEAAAAEAAAAEAAGGGGGGNDKTFNQIEVDKIVQGRLRKQQGEIKKHTDTIAALQGKANITKEERTELETANDSLRTSLMTEKQRAADTQKKEKEKHTSEVTKLTGERDDWKNRFTNSTIDRAIVDAAVVNEAFVPNQLVSILKPDTNLAEILDDEGKPTGELEPKVRFVDKDKEGKKITLSLTVPEAVKKMTEQDQHLNLFKGKGTGGLGGANRGGDSKPQDLAALAKNNPAEYRKRRQEGAKL